MALGQPVFRTVFLNVNCYCWRLGFRGTNLELRICHLPDFLAISRYGYGFEDPVIPSAVWDSSFGVSGLPLTCTYNQQPTNSHEEHVNNSYDRLNLRRSLPHGPKPWTLLVRSEEDLRGAAQGSRGGEGPRGAVGAGGLRSAVLAASECWDIGR